MSGLVQQEEYKVEDSNVAGIGSDKDKEVRKEAAESEKAWEGAGEEVGLQIWRIEKFEVKSVDKSKYGKFFMGDSYIILHTYKDPDNESIKYDLYFWIGKHSTQDEYGTAAYKTVELDSFLDDKPVQHREVHGAESEEFLKLFKNYGKGQIQHLEGGVDSGFNHVNTVVSHDPVMWTFKNTNASDMYSNSKVMVSKAWNKISADGVFVLVTNDCIYQYNGSRSSCRKRCHVRQYINSELKEFRPQIPVEVLDDHEVVEIFAPVIGEPSEDFDIMRVKVKDNSKEDECSDKTLYRYQNDQTKWEEVGRGHELESLTELEDGFLYLVEDSNMVRCCDRRSKADSKNEAVMICAQAHLSDKSHKKSRRCPITAVKHESEFVKSCK